MNSPTITSASLVTSPARGGIAVIILTGPETERIIGEIFRPRSQTGEQGGLALGRIVHDDEVLDEAIVSTLADDCCEINIHGGPHVARKVLSLLSERGASIISDCQADSTLTLSAPGMKNPAITEEFLSALRRVSTPLGASALSCQWSGGLSVLASRSEVDAAALRAAADAMPMMRRLLEPAEVVIAGPPNAGKSALANALVGRNVAIVSQTPGTTRDWVRTLTDADGVPIWLTDTAGLWEEAEGIDAEAVRRAWERIESADLVICVTVGDDDGYGGLVTHLHTLTNVINVAGKCDIARPEECKGKLAVSAKTFTGITALRRAICEGLGFGGFDPSSAMAFTDRQVEWLGIAAEAIDRNDRAGARLALGKLLKADG